jgi:hypothetical protein
MPDRIDPAQIRQRADALRAIKHQPPTPEDSGYGIAYIQGLAALATELFAALGDSPDAIADTLRAAGTAGEPGEYDTNAVSNWLRQLLGDGDYFYGFDGFAVDLEVPDDELDSEDADTIKIPAALRQFLDDHEDPDPGDLDRYRGITVADNGRPELYLPRARAWVCAAPRTDEPDRICGAPVRPSACILHPPAS